MTADAGLFEKYAVAHRLRIGVQAPLTCIDRMPVDELDHWFAYFVLTEGAQALRVKKT